MKNGGAWSAKRATANPSTASPLGMIAITAFAFQEFVNKAGVVDSTSIFFKPLPEVISETANAGYYIPN